MTNPTRADLDQAIIDAQGVFDRLTVKMAQLQMAQSIGNLSQIDTSLCKSLDEVEDLNLLLGNAWTLSTSLDARLWDIDHGYAKPFEDEK